ncbi:hypothetical protein LshimejAT787_0407600 [Lyophyllum shimeji]|uniref:F-box domain-containing protein n=1 Tax=Lyophyllum shimeji TaxID=47721 RepID=A0A9P3PLN0_LYOSH|nr:hypothetical protein LshimejAT787_0407600 [Lyophyllum shimeji]
MSILEQRQLPTEIWSHSISYLSYEDQISLLHVSRKFHDIAVRFIFASVKIYFVAGQTFSEMFQSYPYHFVDMEKIAETMMRHSWEILEHITVHPSFAAAVKTLSVIAYSDSPSVFERLSLGKALLAMPDLKALYWFGRQPELPCEVTDCLPLPLKSLNVQSMTPISPESASRFRSMQIERLQLETLFHTPPRMHSSDPDTSFWDDLLAYSDTFTFLDILWSPRLRRLSLLSRHIDGIPMHASASLLELELYATKDADEGELVGTDLIFRYMPMLESLSLVGYLASEVFLALPHDPRIMPNLRSFRLSAEADSLPEVLGLHAGHQCMSAEDFESLASIITPKMTAIQLVIPWDYDETVAVDGQALDPLMQRLQEAPHLSFVHLYSIGRLLPIDQDDLVNDLMHLDTVGCDRCLWDVHNGSLVQWKHWRVQYAIEEDFRCQDDFWLFKDL